MAVQLFLDDKEVIIDSTQEIKLTKENPYITLSDSYTLDVSIPMDILQNRRFFGNIQRIDATKRYREFACRLLCANVLIMEGTARIVQSTDLLVKVQLACGVSALKMSSEQEGLYIDSIVTEKQGGGFNFRHDLDYGPTSGENHVGYGAILLDSTSNTILNLGTVDVAISRGFPYFSECPRLLDIAKLVAMKLGYSVDMSCLPSACWSIFVITAIQGDVGRKLPHWTVKEFFTQFQNFFGCTFIRSGEKALKLVPLGSYAHNAVTEIVPISEFQVEFSEEDEAEGIINRNVEFEMENADIEMIDQEILSQAGYKEEYTDAGTMENAFRNDSENIRMRKIYMLNGETYVGWKTEQESEDAPAQYELRRVAPFNPLKRFGEAESVKLKIAPVFMDESVECQVGYMYDIAGGYETHTLHLTIPSVSNPYGVKPYYGVDNSSETDNTATLQDLVEGSASVVDVDDKSDIMNVAFIGNNVENVVGKNEKEYREHTYQVHLAFTDFNFKKQLSNNREKWSFSLNELQGYEFYLGQLHKIGFRCSHKVKHIVKFVSPSIPDPTDIFMIRGKLFACEKIEAGIRDGRLDPLMTGYFYEFLS